MQPRSLVLASLATLLVASPALAKRRPPPPTGPRITKVARVALVGCSTDGGDVRCSTGVKYLGELLMSSFSELASAPIACADAKPGSYTFSIGFEYNEGTMGPLDDDRHKAKWPSCVAPLAAQMSAKWLEWYKVLQPIDPTIDVRNAYKVTIKISK